MYLEVELSAVIFSMTQCGSDNADLVSLVEIHGQRFAGSSIYDRVAKHVVPGEKSNLRVCADWNSVIESDLHREL